jgi:hypothetical protein
MFKIGDIIVSDNINKHNVHWLIVDLVAPLVKDHYTCYRVIPLNSSNGAGSLNLNCNYANANYVRAS